jgi:two-component system cell cycle response regulator DivK
VLIVDDDEDSREMYSLALSRMGFQTCAAANAVDAFAKACAVRPDAIVSDFRLPGLSGVDLARLLRGDTRTQDAGIIVLTGYTAEGARQQATQAGCDRFLIKPCAPEALANELQDLLAARAPVPGPVDP